MRFGGLLLLCLPAERDLLLAFPALVTRELGLGAGDQGPFRCDPRQVRLALSSFCWNRRTG